MLLSFSSNQNKTFLEGQGITFQVSGLHFKTIVTEKIARFEFFHSFDFRTHSDSNVVLNSFILLIFEHIRIQTL